MSSVPDWWSHLPSKSPGTWRWLLILHGSGLPKAAANQRVGRLENLCKSGVLPVGRDLQRGGGPGSRIHMPLGVFRDPRCSWTILMQLY